MILRKVTPDKFEEALRPYGGTVLRTSLSREQEQELMKALPGDDPSAPTWEQSPAPGAELSLVGGHGPTARTMTELGVNAAVVVALSMALVLIRRFARLDRA